MGRLCDENGLPYEDAFAMPREYIHDACIVDAKAGEPPRTSYDKARLLDTAKATVAGRGDNYGTPEDNFTRIAAHWNAFLINRHQTDQYKQDGDFLSAGDVAIMMALMKIARLENDSTHADSWIDLAGYAACGAEIETQVRGLPIPPGSKK